MRVVVKGWNRDCGEKEIMNTDQLAVMPVAPETIGLNRGETYLQVQKARFSSFDKVHVWAAAHLNLNGWYQTHLEMDRGDIARLFYLLYGDRELEDIGRLLGSYKEQEEEQAAAITVSKEDARKAIVAQWQRLPAAERANMAQAHQFVIEAMKRYSWRVSGGAYKEAMAWLEPYVGELEAVRA
jgi:hypothetical protein